MNRMKHFVKENLGAILIYTAAGILFLATVSCVTASDLAQIQASLGDLESGTITADQFNDTVDGIATDAASREAALRGMIEKAGGIPTDPLALLMYGGSLIAAIGGGTVASNKVRDARRVKRGEAV